MKDEPITGILQKWRVGLTVPSGFQRKVWQRIEASRAPESVAGFRAFWRWLFPTAAVWQLAAATACVAMLLAGTLGTSTARAEAEQKRAELGQRYVATIDPYLRLAGHQP
jgi:hypothetical protein